LSKWIANSFPARINLPATKAFEVEFRREAAASPCHDGTDE